MPRTYLTHATIVLPDAVLEDASLLIEGGHIVAIEPEQTSGAQEIPLHGQYLLPGLIDLHCDAIEKETEPRAGVLFPYNFAVAQVDRRNAAAGITTPYHAISFSGRESGVRNNQTAAEVARAIRQFARHSLVDNRVHCRFEITDTEAEPILAGLMDDGVVDLLSIMDHSPGQGQFKSLDAYVQYYMHNHSLTHEQACALAAQKDLGRSGAGERVERLLQLAQACHIPTASHDDDSPQRITAMHHLGIAMSEFPINLATAQAASAVHLPTIFGAPNVVRGQSQSGSMRAIEAIRAEVASCLCSDYQPSTLIAAAFTAYEQSDLTLSQAIALVSSNPAAACALHDRGHIACGLRADLIAVATINGLPLVTHCWSGGRQVFQAGYTPGNTTASAIKVHNMDELNRVHHFPHGIRAENLVS